MPPILYFYILSRISLQEITIKHPLDHVSALLADSKNTEISKRTVRRAIVYLNFDLGDSICTNAKNQT